MKAIGITRRLDDLGRIVIPREVRRTLHLREGDAMEMYLQDGDIVLHKLRAGEHLACVDPILSGLRKMGYRFKLADSAGRNAEAVARDISDEEKNAVMEFMSSHRAVFIDEEHKLALFKIKDETYGGLCLFAPCADEDEAADLRPAGKLAVHLLEAELNI